MILQLLVNGIVIGCANALVAFGFALIYNTTRTFHFAHGAVYTFAAYLFYWLCALLGWPMWLATVMTLGLTALLGVMLNRVVYEPLVRRNSSLLIRLLSSLATYTVIINVIVMIYGNEIKVLKTDLQPTISFGMLILSKLQIITVACSLFIFAGLMLLLRATGLGRTVRAMNDDPRLVSVMGINPISVRRFVFALGSLLAGVAAILKGLDVGTEPNAGMAAFINGTVAVVIGGVGIFEGVIFGALLLGILQSVAIWKFSAQWQDAVTFFLLILFLLFRREGIFGRGRQVTEEAAWLT